MSTTEKRMTIAFTREQLRELDALAESLGESPSVIIHRAVTFLYYDLMRSGILKNIAPS